MRNLSDILAQSMQAQRRAGGGSGSPSDRLHDLEGFGSNPGNLRARTYLPEEMAAQAPLVVVLHGCTQTAAGYDRGSGWSTLADRHGFALLFPEQRRANNPNLCFNWFSPQHNARDHGEALSIRQMIGELVRQHDIDPARIHVTGLSAGGAMASVMLASYPELFAGGAIIAGLPFGCASNVPQALERMRGQGTPKAADLSALVRRASDHRGPWPTVSIWHGSADATVASVNAIAILDQWRSIHGVEDQPSSVETVDGYPRRLWRDAAGRDVIEEYSITGMGHGTPLDTLGHTPCGAAAPFMLEAGISSTLRIADFWGLIDTPTVSAGTQRASESVADAPAQDETTESTSLPALRTIRPTRIPPAPASVATSKVGAVIEDALRAAGLMR